MDYGRSDDYFLKLVKQDSIQLARFNLITIEISRNRDSNWISQISIQSFENSAL